MPFPSQGTPARHLRRCPRGAQGPSTPHPTPYLLLLPFPFGLALFQLLGLLLGKAHGLCREEILEAFKATVVFFCRGWKGEGSPSVSGRTRDTEAEAGHRTPIQPRSNNSRSGPCGHSPRTSDNCHVHHGGQHRSLPLSRLSLPPSFVRKDNNHLVLNPISKSECLIWCPY